MDFFDINLQPMPESVPKGSTYEYYLGLLDRQIWLDTDVDLDEGTLSIVKQIIRWNREDKRIPVKERKPIILYCFSFGGDLDLCNSIIDAIRLSKTPVYTVNVGRCMSAGAYIFIAGHKRFIFPHSYFLFHQGSNTVGGTASEMKAQMENYNKQVEDLSELMRTYTKYDDEKIKSNITSEWFVRAKEALENGVCDKMITSLDEIL